MINRIKTSILPTNQHFAKTDATRELNLEAICIFAATGFFLDTDTYWKDTVCLPPAHNHHFDTNGKLISSSSNFDWHYTPRDLSFEQALEEYIQLLTTIIKEQVEGSPVILPLSGGLDSRSQAMVLKDFDNPVHAFSYSFSGGYPEHHIAKDIAKECGFGFESFQIPKGYLWDCIDELAQINKCYSEFTHPRQMAILPQLKKMEGVFSLGHWGDVLFDRGAPEGTTESNLIPLLLKKMLKSGGLYLAEQLWDTWGLEGNFKDYLISRIETSLSNIKIENVSAKVRAFKTSQWAHRWTTTNLSVFEVAHPITLPYYDHRMIEFICNIPEDYLADRRLQIAHLKQDKSLSNITWQAQRPFNINTFQYNKSPYNIPFRMLNKLQRELKSLIGQPYIQRNWELQFLGIDNKKQLEQHLFSKELLEWIPKSVVTDVFNKFYSKDAVYYSHPVSMLLTLTQWFKIQKNNEFI